MIIHIEYIYIVGYGNLHIYTSFSITIHFFMYIIERIHIVYIKYKDNNLSITCKPSFCPYQRQYRHL